MEVLTDVYLVSERNMGHPHDRIDRFSDGLVLHRKENLLSNYSRQEAKISKKCPCPGEEELHICSQLARTVHSSRISRPGKGVAMQVWLCNAESPYVLDPVINRNGWF